MQSIALILTTEKQRNGITRASQTQENKHKNLLLLRQLQNPGLVACYDIRPGNGLGLFSDTHTHMLTYLPHTPTKEANCVHVL